MTWDVPIDHDEAVGWMRARTAVTRPEWDVLSTEAKKKAFVVSGVAQLDLVTQVHDAVERAVAQGTDLDAFKKSMQASLEVAWAGSVKDPAWRLETIFRTNVQVAYSAGRHEQMTDPEVLQERPYWRFDGVDDSRETAVCQACNDVILRADDPWWASHTPPLHFNCRSSISTLDAEEARELGLTRMPPTISAAKDFGAMPGPGAAEWKADLTEYPEQLRLAFEEKQAAAPKNVQPDAPPPPAAPAAPPPPASPFGPPGGGGEGGGDPPQRPKRGPHEAFGLPPETEVRRDDAYIANQHQRGGAKVERELRRSNPAFVFVAGTDFDALEARVWSEGTVGRTVIRDYERIWLSVGAAVGERIQQDREPRLLYFAEIKGKLNKLGVFVYHLVPREKPAK